MDAVQRFAADETFQPLDAQSEFSLEGDWERAVEWASNPAIPAGWREDSLTRTVAAGLLRMGLTTRGESGGGVLEEELRDAPDIIREHGDRLEPVARSLPADVWLDAAVQLYERLVEKMVGGRDRGSYAMAGGYCKVIRSIRRLQGRDDDFERYYKSLFAKPVCQLLSLPAQQSFRIHVQQQSSRAVLFRCLGIEDVRLS